jgi:hypothetical protein
MAKRKWTKKDWQIMKEAVVWTLQFTAVVFSLFLLFQWAAPGN